MVEGVADYAYVYGTYFTQPVSMRYFFRPYGVFGEIQVQVYSDELKGRIVVLEDGKNAFKLRKFDLN